MATAGQRAALGAEEARMEGKGVIGQGMEAAEMAVRGRGRGRRRLPGHSRSRSRSSSYSSSDEEGIRRHHHRRGHHLTDLHGAEGVRTVVTNESEAYCPNPNALNLPKEYETRVQVIQRYPELRTVEKTDYVKEIVNEERTIIVPKTRVVLDEVQHVDRVPVVREVAKTRIEIVHRVVPEEREVTDMVPVIEYVDTPRMERVPRVIVEDVEERIRVPVVREVPVTRMVEVPTGNYCEAPAGDFVNPTHFNLLGHKHGHKTGGILNRTTSSSSSSSSDAEHGALHTTGTHGRHHNNTPLDTTTGTTGIGGTGLPGHHHHNPLDTTTGTGFTDRNTPVDTTTGTTGVGGTGLTGHHHNSPLDTTTGTTGAGGTGLTGNTPLETSTGTGTGLPGHNRRESGDGTGFTNSGVATPTSTSTPSTPRQKRSGLLGRIIHH